MSVSDVVDVVKRTKLSPYTLVLLLAAVVAVAYVALGASLLHERSKQRDMSSQIDSAGAVLAASGDVRKELEDLPARLTDARQDLAAAQAAFPSELNSNGILERILELAGQNQVRVTTAGADLPVAESAEEPTEEPTGESTDESTDESAEETTEDISDGETLSFDLQVEGDFGRLIAFLKALEKGVTSTTTITRFALQQESGQHLLDLELVAHARSLTADSPSAEQEATTDESTETASEGEETTSE